MTSDPERKPDTPSVTAEGETFTSAPTRLRYVDVDAPAPGKSVPVAPRVRWGRIPLPMDLNHINIWLVETEEGCVAVDTGMAVSIGKEAWETIEREAFATMPLRAVFVTHIHPDHIGLAAWLQQRFKVPVWMSRRTHEMAKVMFGGVGAPFEEIATFFRSHGLADVAQIQSIFKPERFARMGSGMPEVEREVADGDIERWAGEEWTAMETNGHAEGHLCLSNAAARLLISGDQVLPTISSNISFIFRGTDPNPLGSFLSSLQRLRQLDAETLVLPSHGRPFRGLQHRIDDLSEHHHEQLDMLTRACVTPKCGYELLPLMFRRELKGMHLFLALGEALAHAEYLVHAGRMERQTSAGLIRYATIAKS